MSLPLEMPGLERQHSTIGGTRRVIVNEYSTIIGQSMILVTSERGDSRGAQLDITLIALGEMVAVAG